VPQSEPEWESTDYYFEEWLRLVGKAKDVHTFYHNSTARCTSRTIAHSSKKCTGTIMQYFLFNKVKKKNPKISVSEKNKRKLGRIR
jgi:hypothetical protein